MTRPFKTQIEIPNPLEDSPDYERIILLVLSVDPGRPAVTRGDPDDWCPSEPAEFEILEAVYEDGSEVPDEAVRALDDETILEIALSDRGELYDD